MKVRVKLFGTLKQQLSDYDPLKGIHIEIPDGAMVKDLLAHLGFTKSEVAIVGLAGQIIKGDSKLIDGACVNLFNRMSGG
jgi:sulfur carrier protein ThiS